MKYAYIVLSLLFVPLVIYVGFEQVKMNSSHMMSGDMSTWPCHQMGGEWMGDCTFDENGEPILDTHMAPVERDGETFSARTRGLPNVQPTEVVTLKDGDTYEMTAEIVKQKIGNKTIKRLAYNRMIPGPLLKVEKDAEITLRFTNKLDVETTLHSHGLRGLDDHDGVPTTMMGKQEPMQPGDSYDYTLTFPDTGVYWYHPHIREDYGQELGLYGNFQVTEGGYWSEVDKEEFLIVDDFAQGELFYKDTATKTLMGRYGDLLLVNNDQDYVVEVQAGEIVRFFLTNVANTRTFDISIEDTAMKLVGGDNGRIEKEQFVEGVVIAPSERWVFESQFDEVGEYPIMHRGEQIARVIVSGDTIADRKDFSVLRTNVNDYSIVRDNLAVYLRQVPDKRLEIDISMPGMEMDGMEHMQHGTGDTEGHGNDGIEWEDEMAAMNQTTDEHNLTWILRDVDTGKENMDIDWVFEKDDLAKIEIYNDPESMHPMQHPIHFHGQRFTVISRDGVPVDNLQWEDTTLIPLGQKIELLLHTTNPGTWMSHCHIAEHLSAGMMFNFTVKD